MKVSRPCLVDLGRTVHVLVLVLLSLLRPALATTCYDSTGAVTDNVPCNPDADVSVCCGANQYGIACLDNKLCQGWDGQVFRGTCTDKTWKSPDCPQFCKAKVNNGLVHVCSTTGGDTDYCCDNEDANCCDAGSKATQFQLQPAVWQTSAILDAASKRYNLVSRSFSPSSTPTTTTSSTTTTTTTGISSTPTPNPAQNSSPGSINNNNQPAPTSNTAADSNELSPGAKAGIGVGAAAGAVLLAVLAYMAGRMRRMQRVIEASNQWRGAPVFASGGDDGGEGLCGQQQQRDATPVSPYLVKSAELPAVAEAAEVYG